MLCRGIKSKKLTSKNSLAFPHKYSQNIEQNYPRAITLYEKTASLSNSDTIFKGLKRSPKNSSILEISMLH